MDQKEKLKKEAQEILAGRRASISIQKKILYDKTANQFSIKIPKDVASAAQLNIGSEVKIIINPTKEEFEEAKSSHIIIYGKEK